MAYTQLLEEPSLLSVCTPALLHVVRGEGQDIHDDVPALAERSAG